MSTPAVSVDQLAGTPLLWRYGSPEVAQAGALPPQPLRLDYGRPLSGSPFLTGRYEQKWRAIESGYHVEPADCPAVRLVARHGWTVRCPGRVEISRVDPPSTERSFGADWAQFGAAHVAGDPWPGSDSELVASWIAGSDYVKIHTGIVVLFPRSTFLYQGPVPNAALDGSSAIAGAVMAGLEQFRSDRSIVVDGTRLGVASMNVIVKHPPAGEILRVAAGEPLAWFFPVTASSSLSHAGRGPTGGSTP